MAKFCRSPSIWDYFIYGRCASNPLGFNNLRKTKDEIVKKNLFTHLKHSLIVFSITVGVLIVAMLVIVGGISVYARFRPPAVAAQKQPQPLVPQLLQTPEKTPPKTAAPTKPKLLPKRSDSGISEGNTQAGKVVPSPSDVVLTNGLDPRLWTKVNSCGPGSEKIFMDNSVASGKLGCGLELTGNTCLIMDNQSYALSENRSGICGSEHPPVKREVTPEQVKVLQSTLKGTHEQLQIYCTIDDDEGCTYADQIRKAFNSAGWDAGDSIHVWAPKSHAPNSVAVITKLDTPPSAAIHGVESGLTAIHIWFLRASGKELKNGEVAVSVDGNLAPVSKTTQPQ